MGCVALKCDRAELLFHETEGLLLSAGLLPVDGRHRTHVLTFQLSYLGTGELTVRIELEDGGEPTHLEASLRGADSGLPGVWLASVPVSDDRLDCRLTILGQGDEDCELRGSLVAHLSGYAPLLTAVTRASVTTG
jgi:hypothetical protein